jgi:predicted MFS family arabinose efflux permease
MGGVVLLLALLAWFTLRDSPGERGLELLGGTPEEQPGAARTSSLAWGSVYRSGVVWHLGLIYIAWGIAYIYITFFNKYLVTEVGLSDQTAGRLWSLVGWLSLTCGFTWGAVSDRWGRKAGLALVYTVHAGSFLLFAVGGGAAPYIVSSILFGLSAWSIPAIMAATCGDQVGPRLAPAALGFLTLFFGIGQTVGPYVAGLLADRLGTFVPAFLIAAGAALLGALGALLLPPSYAPKAASIG